MDGTGLSFEPLEQVLPKDVHVKVIHYPTDRLLSFEETLQCAKDQIQPDQENIIVIAESFSGPVAIALVPATQSNMLDPLFNICQVAKTGVVESPQLSPPRVISKTSIPQIHAQACD
jgi:hypothetical protein